MRQLSIEVQRGQGHTILQLAEKYQGANLSQLEANTTRGKIDLVIAYLPNRNVEEFMEELEDFRELHITLVPRGFMPLQPPVAEIPDRIIDVQAKSSLEVFLAGLQSVGAWQGFIAYAVAGAIIVWIGLYTNSSFLLVAAMLIAPFAGPAMNVAIATARGDGFLLRTGLIRYLVAIVVTVLVTAGLSLILNQELASNSMVESSKVATVSVLLPLIGGAAGALNSIQAERSSLVSGTAVGMLVAAALAPPAGTAGMAMQRGLEGFLLRATASRSDRSRNVVDGSQLRFFIGITASWHQFGCCYGLSSLRLIFTRSALQTRQQTPVSDCHGYYGCCTYSLIKLSVYFRS